jgi:HicB_like antitoxin of bacterial toxin-antitoxin system
VRAYTLVLDPDEEDGGYTVTVPALPGCITQGDSLGEALECETPARRFIEQEDKVLRQDDEGHRRLELVVLHVA